MRFYLHLYYSIVNDFFMNFKALNTYTNMPKLFFRLITNVPLLNVYEITVFIFYGPPQTPTRPYSKFLLHGTNTTEQI